MTHFPRYCGESRNEKGTREFDPERRCYLVRACAAGPSPCGRVQTNYDAANDAASDTLGGDDLQAPTDAGDVDATADVVVPDIAQPDAACATPDVAAPVDAGADASAYRRHVVDQSDNPAARRAGIKQHLYEYPDRVQRGQRSNGGRVRATSSHRSSRLSELQCERRSHHDQWRERVGNDLTPQSDNSYTTATQSTIRWRSQDQISVTASGADVPGFTTNVTMPPSITVNSPSAFTALTITRSSGFSTRWTQASTGSVIVVIAQGVTGSLTAISCIYPTSAGQATIDPSLLNALAPGETTLVAVKPTGQMTLSAVPYPVTVAANNIGYASTATVN